MSVSEISGIQDSDNTVESALDNAMTVHQEVEAALKKLLAAMLKEYLEDKEQTAGKIIQSCDNVTILGQGGYSSMDALVNDTGVTRKGKK